MAADVKTGPAVDGGCYRRRLERHIRRGCRAIEREQAQADARDYALPGSAGAGHRSNIPAVPAIMPARSHQRNKIKRSIRPGSIGFPVFAVKSQIKGRHHPFPSLIASHSQLEELTWEMLLNGIAE